MHKLHLTSIPLLFLTAAFAAHSFARTPNQSRLPDPESQERRAVAVGTVRTINTAEVAYWYGSTGGGKQHRNRYAAWSELYASGILDEMRQSTPDVSSLLSADGVQGYKFALIVSPDGKSYELALHDAKPQGDGFSVFTDQSGLIYTGSPLQ